MQARAVAVADEDESARPLFQHIGEILRPHHRRDVSIDLGVAGDLARHTGRERRLARMVHQHRIAAVIGDFGARAVKPRRALDHFADPLLQQVAHLRRAGCAQCRAAARAAE